jgi:hypothetical protein
VYHSSCCIISIEKKNIVVTERVVEEKSMYRSFELIYEALNKISWFYYVLCLYMVNGMLTFVLFSLLCICFNTVCMYDFIFNV